jgi:ADP-heptose:LPS heptosyltransferase
VDTVETLDAEWLARGRGGRGLAPLLRTARGWRSRDYHLAINFEPDVRSNLLVAMAGAAWTAGYGSAGGGAVLDQALEYDPRSHTSDNALRLVAAVFSAAPPPTPAPLIAIPQAHRERAAALIGSTTGPVIALHASGGRPIKQWPPDRFAAAARHFVLTRGATIVLTGTAEDRPLVDAVARALPHGSFVDASTTESLLTAAAVLSRADLLITGDTGPMHLAQAVGTPVVAVFGPSDPRRYAPRGARDRVVRIDLACAPCNRIRLPPARCLAAGTPDCLAGVTADAVILAATEVLDR